MLMNYEFYIYIYIYIYIYDDDDENHKIMILFNLEKMQKNRGKNEYFQPFCSLVPLSTLISATLHSNVGPHVNHQMVINKGTTND